MGTHEDLGESITNCLVHVLKLFLHVSVCDTGQDAVVVARFLQPSLSRDIFGPSPKKLNICRIYMNITQPMKLYIVILYIK